MFGALLSSPVEEAFQSVSAWVVFVWAAAIITVGIVLVKNWEGITNFVLNVKQLLTLSSDISYIKQQLSTNGGSSVKDAATAAARSAAETALEVGRLSESVRELGDHTKRASELAHEASARAQSAIDLIAVVLKHEHDRQSDPEDHHDD